MGFRICCHGQSGLLEDSEARTLAEENGVTIKSRAEREGFVFLGRLFVKSFGHYGIASTL